MHSLLLPITEKRFNACNIFFQRMELRAWLELVVVLVTVMAVKGEGLKPPHASSSEESETSLTHDGLAGI